MSGRKAKAANPYDIDAATIEYPCENDSCTHRFRYTGKEYKKNRELSCPVCHWHTTVDDDKLFTIFAQRPKP